MSNIDFGPLHKILEEYVMEDIKKEHAKYHRQAHAEIDVAIKDIEKLWNTKVITDVNVYNGLFAKLRTYDAIKYHRILVVPIPGICDYGPDVIFVPRKIKGQAKILNILVPGSVQPLPGKKDEPVIIETSMAELPK